jgi:hypothetical protein
VRCGRAQQRGIVNFDRAWGDRIAEPDIDLDRHAGGGDRRRCAHANPAVVDVLADLRSLQALDVKDNAIFVDGLRADFPQVVGDAPGLFSSQARRSRPRVDRNRSATQVVSSIATSRMKRSRCAAAPTG